ncbi:MAG: VOC family protein [Gemmatimonadota bacterium]|nr:VOC family protein [Gemmatimonadota bacterium]
MSSTLIPALRYRDAPAAIAFLCDAFGFRRHLVVEGEDEGTIAHAQLVHGTGMIMLGTSREDEFGSLLTTVERAGKPTGSLYLVVSDVDAHAEQARAVGAEIVQEPEDQGYGGRLYTARDVEGNLWSFGSYDPWAEG